MAELALNQGRKRKLETLVRQEKLEQLEGIRLDYHLLDQAFRHPSFCVEKQDAAMRKEKGIAQGPYVSNQRLEFLGDAVLGLVMAQTLYRRYPEASEGELTRLRAALVCERSLAQAARQMDLGEYLLMGKGAMQSRETRRDSMLADAFEALLGALYLCGATMKALESFILKVVQTKITQLDQGLDEDFKGQLQAWVQRDKNQQLTYKILDEQGPDHQKIFLAGAYLDDKEIGRGRGFSKQEAQKQAAKMALYQLKLLDKKEQ